MKRFELKDGRIDITVEIDGNVVRARVQERGWQDDTHEVTVKIPDALARTVSSIEAFSCRRGFRIDHDDLEFLDDAGEAYDGTAVLKLYDDEHGGGFMWQYGWDQVTWGIARGPHVVLSDGTIWHGDPVMQDAQSEASYDA